MFLDKTQNEITISFIMYSYLGNEYRKSALFLAVDAMLYSRLRCDKKRYKYVPILDDFKIETKKIKAYKKSDKKTHEIQFHHI